MHKRKLTMSVVTAAALLLPLSFVSPALAEELDTANTSGSQIIEVPTAEAPEGGTSGTGVPAEETPVAEGEVPSAEVENSDEGSIEIPAEGDITEEATEPEAPAVDVPATKPETNSAPNGAQPGASTQTLTGTFKAVRLSSPGKINNPSSGTKTKNLAVALDGPASGYYSANMTVGLVKKNSGVRTNNTYKPTLQWVRDLSPTQNGRVQVRVPYYTTPGVYKLRIALKEGATGVTKAVAKNVTIQASAKYSKSRSGMSGSARAGQTFPVSVTAPDYQAGAKATVYYRAPGSPKYVAVKSGRLKASTYNSKVTVKVPKAYNVAGNGGRIYVKIGAVSYAPAYNMSSAPITRR